MSGGVPMTALDIALDYRAKNRAPATAGNCA
jgi:hypothetical protein